MSDFNISFHDFTKAYVESIFTDEPLGCAIYTPSHRWTLSDEDKIMRSNTEVWANFIVFIESTHWGDDFYKDPLALLDICEAWDEFDEDVEWFNEKLEDLTPEEVEEFGFNDLMSDSFQQDLIENGNLQSCRDAAVEYGEDFWDRMDFDGDYVGVICDFDKLQTDSRAAWDCPREQEYCYNIETGEQFGEWFADYIEFSPSGTHDTKPKTKQELDQLFEGFSASLQVLNEAALEDHAYEMWDKMQDKADEKNIEIELYACHDPNGRTCGERWDLEFEGVYLETADDFVAKFLDFAYEPYNIISVPFERSQYSRPLMAEALYRDFKPYLLVSQRSFGEF